MGKSKEEPTKGIRPAPVPVEKKMKELATKEEFETLINTEKRLIVIDFYATWCGPCKILAPILEGLANEHQDVVFVKIDVDENSDTAEDCSISAMPTIQFYKDSKKVKEVVGANEAKIKEAIAEFK